MTRKYCFNPFNKSSHKKKILQLRNVTIDILKKHGNKFKKYFKKCDKLLVCDSCRKLLSKPVDLNQSNSNASKFPSSSEENTTTSENSVENAVVISPMNKSLRLSGCTPIKKEKFKAIKKYRERKWAEIQQSLNEKFGKTSVSADNEVIEQLKEAFKEESTNYKKRIQILTVLPKSWSISKVTSEFGCSTYMVKQARKLVAKYGILALPTVKRGKSLPESVKNLAEEFYREDGVSQLMPGKNDVTKIRTSEGENIKIQKRLLLANLKEVHAIFKQTYPDIKVSFSKFAQLRPKNCVLAGTSGTHRVCVCSYHENVKLMFMDGNFTQLSKNHEIVLTTYRDCLKQIVCDSPSLNCFFRECNACPGITPLKRYLEKLYENESENVVKYRQWITDGRTSLDKIEKSLEEFFDDFFAKLSDLLKHSFIADQQSGYLKNLKVILEPTEAIILLDFSENYTFLIQNEIQSYHWAKGQASLHTIVVYYRSLKENEIKHLNFVIISDCLTHNSVMVHLHLGVLIDSLRKVRELQNVQKLIYFSDGAASQYKNRKNFINLVHHATDFGIHAEWHFFATSHGKSPCDGLGGTVKRLAAKASIQGASILTPIDLYEWCQENWNDDNHSDKKTSIRFLYTSTEDYLKHEEKLTTRFENAQTIPATRSFHCFKPISTTSIAVKRFSSEETERVYKLSNFKCLEINEIQGFVACAYKLNWWIAHVTHVNVEEEEVRLSFLYPKGPHADFFHFPKVQDTVTLPYTDILSLISPAENQRKRIKVTEMDQTNATSLLKTRFCIP